MKILFVHNRYRHRGGEEQAIDNLAHLLSSKGHEIQRFERRSEDWAAHHGWNRLADALKTVYSFSAAQSLNDCLTEFKPDIVHVHNVFPVISPSSYKVLRERAFPTIQSIHNYRFLCANGLFLTPQGQICERCKGGSFWNAVRLGCYGNSRLRTVPMAASLGLHRLLHTFERGIDRYIAPTFFVQAKLVEAGFPAEKITVIPHLSPTPQTPDKRSATPLFVYVGRLSKEKGVLTLLSAFAEAGVGELVVIGDGPLRRECEHWIAKRPHLNVSLLGQLSTPDVTRWLARAWTLVVPSQCYETFGQVILEAWAVGTPVICSAIGALRELVKNDETGWTFEPGHVKALADRLQWVAKSLAVILTLSEKCKVTMQNIYNNEEIYSKLISVYEHAIDRRIASESH